MRINLSTLYVEKLLEYGLPANILQEIDNEPYVCRASENVKLEFCRACARVQVSEFGSLDINKDINLEEKVHANKSITDNSHDEMDFDSLLILILGMDFALPGLIGNIFR